MLWKQKKSVVKRPKTKYEAAFRLEAVRRVTQDGQAATRVAPALGMSEALLDRTQAIASLSRSGSPYDNASAESGCPVGPTSLT